MIETNTFILESNQLMVERIIERIKMYEEKLALYMKQQPNFLQYKTFFMYSAIINELYILLSSFDNKLIIDERAKRTNAANTGK